MLLTYQVINCRKFCQKSKDVNLISTVIHLPIIAFIFAIPISYSFIIATKFIVEYFDGTLWPGRFIGFAMGITSFAIMTNVYMNEGISTKTAVSLVLATTLVAIQILWK